MTKGETGKFWKDEQVIVRAREQIASNKVAYRMDVTLWHAW